MTKTMATFHPLDVMAADVITDCRSMVRMWTGWGIPIDGVGVVTHACPVGVSATTILTLNKAAVRTRS